MALKFTEVTTVLTQVGNTDLFVVSSNTAGNTKTATVTYENLFANVQVDSRFSANLAIPSGSAPADSSDFTGSSETMWTDGDYLYISTSSTNVKRVSLDSF